jgi:hypothetical protein
MERIIWWIIFIGLITIISRHLSGRDYYARKIWPIQIHYYPPQGLTPAEWGYIDNDRFDARDLTATLYDWHTRWLITIEQSTQKSTIFHKVRGWDYRFKWFEHTIWTRMFADRDSFSFEQLDTYGRESQDEFFDLARMALDAGCNEYYGRGPRRSRQSHTLVWQGAIYYHHLLWYKEFIKTVESDKLRELVTQDPDFINKTIPWAVMFGLETRFSQQFEQLERAVWDHPLWSDSSNLGIQAIHDMLSLLGTRLWQSRSYRRRHSIRW